VSDSPNRGNTDKKNGCNSNHRGDNILAEELRPELIANGSCHWGSISWVNAHDFFTDSTLARILAEHWTPWGGARNAIGLLDSSEDVQASVLWLRVLLLELLDVDRGPVNTQRVVARLVALAIGPTKETVHNQAVTDAILAGHIVVNLNNLEFGNLAKKGSSNCFVQTLALSLAVFMHTFASTSF